MMKNAKRKLTLDSPVTYQIKVLGQLGKNSSDWAGGLKVTVEHDDNDMLITTLTGTLDQAALLGHLRRLYSLGLPLILVIWKDEN